MKFDDLYGVDDGPWSVFITTTNQPTRIATLIGSIAGEVKPAFS